ncbi:MAG: ribose 5-phosphate isomerase B [Ruminococcaceae bacterium]|nr:ribose 5-phosphate isomerase B [Oscillospiraceae bacterium]
MIAIGSDHGGFELKEILVKYLEEEGYEYIDCGTFDENSVDYPDIADVVCREVTEGSSELGILVCGTGIGMNMCANKHKGIRAAQCGDTFSAKMTRQHNDANVLTLGGRVVGPELAKEIVREFLTNKFQGGRHQTRVEKMMSFEN